MNRKEYLSDTRYAKVLEQMDLLQIMDITTTRQSKMVQQFGNYQLKTKIVVY